MIPEIKANRKNILRIPIIYIRAWKGKGPFCIPTLHSRRVTRGGRGEVSPFLFQNVP